jgi:hypothetical protein
VANLSTLVDDFDDNSIGSDWPLSYGGVSETGGRARVPCSSASYAGYQTDTIWTFDSVFFQIPTFPALAGATVECYTSAWIFSAGQDAGTHVGFLGDHTTGNLYFMSRTGYVDGGAVSVTLDPATHAWWRLRISGGNLIWETAPDGSTWTTRRTLATPAWLSAATDCKLLLESHRNDGTNNFSEFDNVNVVPFATVEGAAAAPLGGLAGSASGLRTVSSSALSALGGLSAVTAGVRTVAGAASAAPGGLSATMAGVRQVAGSAMVVLAGPAGSASGSRAVSGSAAVSLGALAVSVSGVRTVPGSASVLLGGLTGSASSVSAITARPSAGTTTRPFSGVTARP